MPGLAVIAHTVWGQPGPASTTPATGSATPSAAASTWPWPSRAAHHRGRPAAKVAALGADRVVDLGDATLMPGFVDAHVHLSATGLADHGADLRQARSVAELLDRVRRPRPGTARRPALGRRLRRDLFRAPRAALAGRAGHRGRGPTGLPVAGRRPPGAGHPRRAGRLGRAGGDRLRPGPGRRPHRGDRGDANHLARRFALATLPAATLAAAQDAALCQAARRGVACVHEMGGPDIAGRRDFELLLDRVEALPIEVIGYWGDLDLEYVEDRKLAQVGGDLFLDGSLGSHTAALSTPYEDRPDTSGVQYHDDRS